VHIAPAAVAGKVIVADIDAQSALMPPDGRCRNDR